MAAEAHHLFEAEGPFNVILLSLDTLRQDHVGAYGCNKPLTPTMDRLAAEGVLFEDALVNCGWTLPQYVTLHTGVVPIKHGVIYLGEGGAEDQRVGRYDRRIPARFRTLAELFQDAGYLTFGFGNQNGYGGGWKYGFYRGMRHYSTVFPYNNMMERVVEPVAGCLHQAGSRPFFLYLHTNDTHEPFAASEPFGSRWGTSYQNRYEGEVTYVDHHLGLIIEELDRLHLSERTLVVVTSDHGSEFKEHGFLEKKLNLYEEISRIPVTMTLPTALPQGRRVPGLCQTMDVPATILDICGLTPPETMDGRSLLPRILGDETRAPDVVFAHTVHERRSRLTSGRQYRYEHFSARSNRYKFIRTVPLAARPEGDKSGSGIAGRFARLRQIAQLTDGVFRELYDLKADPKEQTNIIEAEPAIVRDLETKLDGWIVSCEYRPLKSSMKS